ncbi:MAG TPA: UDP-N-acetylglucosamine--N-acetylmuramyl-(pentapeptide) pyrophosphoryl-undecaprenol N-acetylglucosamine transferase [bacterium]|nr:UDP-N-acetylglucosamine--N-acetylmuramyl-(pentapeptide) pyrophosphoryl-undecaprenol N-acetylglucosamine transferase [bacterium]
MAHHVLMTGGGTLGPVTPLLAVAAEWKKREPEAKMSWVGTAYGPERALVEGAKIDFFSIPAPKLDRTRIWKLPLVPCLFVWSCVRAFMMLGDLQPDIVLSAGAYVSVPVAWMAKLRGIPVWVHQLDVVPGLANKLMAPVAKRVSVTWNESLTAFPANKTEVVGAMARKFVNVGEREMARERYGFAANKPTVLVMGGGTGAASLNEMMAAIGPELVKHANVIHLTGKGKMLSALGSIANNYVPLEFLHEGMADAYAVADVVVARAGMGTIAELSALGKPTVLIPIPASHQEANAKALTDRRAAEVVTYLTPQTLMQAITRLLEHEERRTELAHNIRGVFALNADERIVHECLLLLEPVVVPVAQKV